MRSLVSLDEAGYVVRRRQAGTHSGAKTFSSAPSGRFQSRTACAAAASAAKPGDVGEQYHVRERDSRLCLFRVEFAAARARRRAAHKPRATRFDLDGTSAADGALGRPHGWRRAGLRQFRNLRRCDGLPLHRRFRPRRSAGGRHDRQRPNRTHPSGRPPGVACPLTDASYRLSLVLGAPLPREVGAPRIISLPSAETGSP